MSTDELVLAMLGLAAVTVLTRCFFFISDREWPIPVWLQEGLRHAPLAALMAIIAPSVLMDAQGQWLQTWQDARLAAVAVAVMWFLWRRDLLGTILAGTAVMLLMRLGLGW
ncbi:MAG: AzlD domain-containing protein [Betaproteobacteria bacterium]|nr:AzlD domain-containing protein [Betaproteobacteria bacterium]